MHKLKSIAIIALLGIAALGMTSAPAQAILVEQDLNAAGDKLVTLDTATGLEWLDVTATLGSSYNAAELTSFVTAQGFRHANTTEVATLYFNAGATVQTVFPVAANFAGVQELILKLGCTANCATNTPFQNGLADLDPFFLPLASLPFVQLNLSASTARALSPNANFSKASGSSSLGNYLVRAAAISVPEPSTLLLFGVGLAGLAGFARRRRA